MFEHRADVCSNYVHQESGWKKARASTRARSRAKVLTKPTKWIIKTKQNQLEPYRHRASTCLYLSLISFVVTLVFFFLFSNVRIFIAFVFRILDAIASALAKWTKPFERMEILLGSQFCCFSPVSFVQIYTKMYEMVLCYRHNRSTITTTPSRNSQ